MDTPKPISIVICTFNGEAFLEEVINSIINQEKFNEIIDKVIIVDNASTDETKNIIHRFQELYPIIEYIYEEKPGLTHARKHGALVRSDWVTYIDDDNIMMPGWLKEAKRFIDENTEVGVFCGASIPMIRDSITENDINM